MKSSGKENTERVAMVVKKQFVVTERRHGEWNLMIESE